MMEIISEPLISMVSLHRTGDHHGIYFNKMDTDELFEDTRVIFSSAIDISDI